MKAMLRGKKFIAHKETEERSLDKLSSKLIKKHTNIQINTIRNEKGCMTTETKEIQGMLRSYYKNLQSTKLENIKGQFSGQVTYTKIKSRPGEQFKYTYKLQGNRSYHAKPHKQKYPRDKWF